MMFNLKTGALEILTLAPIVLALRFVRKPGQGPAAGRAPQAGRAEVERT